MTHLDTNFIIAAMQGRSKQDGAVRRWLAADEPLGMSAIAWAELLCGPISSSDTELARGLLHQIHDFTPADAAMAAKLFCAGGRRRRSLPDCMIAATAIRIGAALATDNPADFRQFQPFGLQLV